MEHNIYIYFLGYDLQYIYQTIFSPLPSRVRFMVMNCIMATPGYVWSASKCLLYNGWDYLLFIPYKKCHMLATVGEYTHGSLTVKMVEYNWNQRVLNDLQRTRFSCGSMIWLLLHPLALLSNQQFVSLSQSSCVSPVKLTWREKGWEGVGEKSQIKRPRRSLVLYKSLNALLRKPAQCLICC